MIPIIHTSRLIGTSEDLPPSERPGLPGPWIDVLRTEGPHDEAQMLAITLGVLQGLDDTPHGPLAAQVFWGVRGGAALAEIDIPMGGVTFGVVASQVAVTARYDGQLLVNGQPLDPSAAAVAPPRARVTAMIGYGTPALRSTLTRTVRLDDIGAPGIDPALSGLIRIPAFARAVRVSGVNLRNSAFVVRAIGFDGARTLEEHEQRLGEEPRTHPLSGDVTQLELENFGPGRLQTPALVFQLGL